SMQHGGDSQMELRIHQRLQQQLQQLNSSLSDPMTADMSGSGCGAGSLPSSLTCGLEGAQRAALYRDMEPTDSEGPDLSWIDQIVMEDGLEVPDEFARAIVSKTATKYRTEFLHGVVC
ncbi:unnamed protein product, partial [Effrenium voratum]